LAIAFRDQGPFLKEVSNTQVDIEFAGIELGSYGIRSCDFLDWVYGTGVAEPRLSSIMGKYGITNGIPPSKDSQG
jgi:hypothetical protein